LIGDASGYVDPLTGEGIYAALWTADALAQCVTDGWEDLPAALSKYARQRARRQQAKTALCELFQQVIARPWVANGILWMLAQQQAVADSFIGIVGNSYPPLRGFARIARHALAF
jgi:flavin-dependent dehydrogenase